VLPHFDRLGRCPACRKSRADATPDFVYTILLLAVAAFIPGDPGGKAVTALAIWPLTLIAVVMHEAAHALAAKLLGWRVYVVSIGGQEAWIRFRWGRSLLLLNRRLLGGGHCLAAPEVRVPGRGAIAIFTAVPILMHAVAAVAAHPWASGVSLGGSLVAMFVAIHALMVPWNAWPRHLPHRNPPTPTDGRSLLDLWRFPEAHAAKWHLAVGLSAFQAHMLEGRPDEAFAAVQRLCGEPASEPAAACLAYAAHATGRGEHALPHVASYARAMDAARPCDQRRLSDRDLAARGLFRGREHEEYIRGSLLVGLDRVDEALALSERQLAVATSDEARALWQGCVALSLLLAGRDLDRAEDAARWAHARLPWVAFVETAWGMVRIERGDLDAGLAAFTRARRTDATGGMSALHKAWTAVAHVRRGRREDARRMLEELRVPGVWPACPRRAEHALS
jgi:hypothetical protein